MSVFKALANDTRLRRLHALVRAGELSVGDLAAAVDMKPQAVSNQLQRLTDRGILGSRRLGTNIYYRIVDRCTVELLDQGLCLVDCSAVREVIPTVEGLRGTSCMAAARSPSPEVVEALTA